MLKLPGVPELNESVSINDPLKGSLGRERGTLPALDSRTRRNAALESGVLARPLGYETATAVAGPALGIGTLTIIGTWSDLLVATQSS